jgi:hypothetical protein
MFQVLDLDLAMAVAAAKLLIKVAQHQTVTDMHVMVATVALIQAAAEATVDHITAPADQESL